MLRSLYKLEILIFLILNGKFEYKIDNFLIRSDRVLEIFWNHFPVLFTAFMGMEDDETEPDRAQYDAESIFIQKEVYEGLMVPFQTTYPAISS